MDADRPALAQALGEVVALEQARDRVLRRELDDVGGLHTLHPLRVEADLRALGIEDLEHLLLVGLGVGGHLLAVERLARLGAAGRVADHAGEIADQEDRRVPAVLEVAELLQHGSGLFADPPSLWCRG